MKKNILIHMNIIWNLKFSFHKDWNTAIHICLNMSMTASMLQLQKWILESDSARPQSLKYLHFGILEKKFTNSCLRQLSLASSVAPALDKRNHLSGWYKKYNQPASILRWPYRREWSFSMYTWEYTYDNILVISHYSRCERWIIPFCFLVYCFPFTWK